MGEDQRLGRGWPDMIFYSLPKGLLRLCADYCFKRMNLRLAHGY
jgi:hypothetical protein